MPDLLTAVPVTAYWLFRIIAIIFSLVFALIKRKAFGLTLFGTFILAAFAVFGAIVGAKALYIVGQIIMRGGYPNFWTWRNWIVMSRAGGILYGSVFGVVGMILLFAKLFKHKATDLLGLAAITLMGANFFSRLGCYYSGCCYGIRLADGNLFPYQLTEGILSALFFLGFVLWRPERKHKDAIFPIAAILYSVTRFALEFFRGDGGRGILLSLSSSQWIALFMVAAAVVWLFIVRPKSKEEHMINEAHP